MKMREKPVTKRAACSRARCRRDSSSATPLTPVMKDR